MTISIRTGLLIALWIIATIVVAIVTNDNPNSTKILASISAPLLIVAIISIFADQMKDKEK